MQTLYINSRSWRFELISDSSYSTFRDCMSSQQLVDYVREQLKEVSLQTLLQYNLDKFFIQYAVWITQLSDDNAGKQTLSHLRESVWQMRGADRWRGGLWQHDDDLGSVQETVQFKRFSKCSVFFIINRSWRGNIGVLHRALNKSSEPIIVSWNSGAVAMVRTRNFNPKSVVVAVQVNSQALLYITKLLIQWHIGSYFEFCTWASVCLTGRGRVAQNFQRVLPAILF